VISRARIETAIRELSGLLTTQLRQMFGDRVGFTLFLFTFSERGRMAYISNAQREDMIALVKEWLAYQESGLTTDPPGSRGRA
jgi:hypothetical protein